MKTFLKTGKLSMRQSRANLLKGCVTTMDKRLATKYLAFLSMSDGGLILHKGCVNSSFSIMMKKENFDYIERYAIPALEFINVGFHVVEREDKYKGVISKIHPFLTSIRDRVYFDNRQSPSAHDMKQLDWEAMAILFMADGSVQWGKNRLYPMLNFCSFSYPELCWLKIQIKERLGIDVNIYKCGKYFRYGVPAKDCDTFFDGVRPYLVDSFMYKHPDGKPQLFVG